MLLKIQMDWVKSKAYVIPLQRIDFSTEYVVFLIATNVTKKIAFTKVLQ